MVSLGGKAVPTAVVHATYIPHGWRVKPKANDAMSVDCLSWYSLLHCLGTKQWVDRHTRFVVHYLSHESHYGLTFVRAWRSTPLSSKIPTVSVCPAWQATWSGLVPCCMDDKMLWWVWLMSQKQLNKGWYIAKVQLILMDALNMYTGSPACPRHLYMLSIKPIWLNLCKDTTYLTWTQRTRWREW